MKNEFIALSKIFVNLLLSVCSVNVEAVSKLQEELPLREISQQAVFAPTRSITLKDSLLMMNSVSSNTSSQTVAII